MREKRLKASGGPLLLQEEAISTVTLPVRAALASRAEAPLTGSAKAPPAPHRAAKSTASRTAEQATIDTDDDIDRHLAELDELIG